MKRIAIVGNIASGKSRAEHIISGAGYKTLCTDMVVHILYTKPEVQDKIYDIFETIDRHEISSVVFSDNAKKQELEAILHPLVKDEIIDFFEKNKEEKLVFVAVPLLFEAKMEDLFDYIIFISADEKIRLNRLMARNKISEKEAKERINAQKPESEKISKSNFVVENNSSLDELKNNLQKVLDKLNED